MSLSVPGSRLSETNKHPGEQEMKMTASSFFFRLSQCSVGRSGIENADFINSFISFVVAETLVRN